MSSLLGTRDLRREGGFLRCVGRVKGCRNGGVSDSYSVGGRIKTSQLGSNQNQPLFSYKPFEDVLARG